MTDANSRMTSLSGRLTLAHLLADQSAKAILPHFRRVIAVENKLGRAGYDPVTAADRNAERIIAKLIGKAYPEDGLIGEEFGASNAAARFRWVVDPIDGTRSFIMGQPLWGTLIGLLDGPSPVIGLMNQPYTGERFFGSAQGAFFRRGASPSRRLRSRKGVQLADAILTSTHPDLMQDADADAFRRLSAEVRMTRFGGDCYNYCLVAAGFVDTVVEAGLKTYDIVALIPIIEQAGGVVTTWDGAPATDGGRIVASGDRRLHERVLKVLARG